MAFDAKALEDMWLCPNSRSKLVVDGDSVICVDPECRLRFDIRNDIPIMLIDEATELKMEEWGGIMQRQGRDSITGESSDSEAAK